MCKQLLQHKTKMNCWSCVLDTPAILDHSEISTSLFQNELGVNIICYYGFLNLKFQHVVTPTNSCINTVIPSWIWKTMKQIRMLFIYILKWHMSFSLTWSILHLAIPASNDFGGLMVLFVLSEPYEKLTNVQMDWWTKRQMCIQSYKNKGEKE